MKKIVVVILLKICVGHLHAQSEFLLKGHSGFEIGYTFATSDKIKQHIGSIGSSIGGNVDVGLGFSSFHGDVQFVLASAVHFGGAPGTGFFSIGAAYAIAPNSENFFTYGPTVYFRPKSNGALVIPSIGIQFATVRNIPEVVTFSLNISTNKKTSFIFRPSYTYVKNNSFFSFGFGFLFSS